MAATSEYHRLESLPRHEVETLTRNTENIRNVSVLSIGSQRVQLGNLLARSSSDAGRDDRIQDIHDRDTLAKRILQSFSVKPEGADRKKQNQNGYLLNIITDPDCPAQPQAAALSLRITDGAILVLDAGLGIRSQAERLLSTALLERNQVIVLLDIESLLAQQRSKEDVYQTLNAQIRTINGISKRSGQLFCQARIHPVVGNVAFCSLAHGWAISLPAFAARYSEKFGISTDHLARHPWGENYFNPETRVWNQEGEHSGNSSERSFNAFILGPIFKIYDAPKSNAQGIQNILATFGIALDDTEQRLTGERLLQAAMHKLFPASDTILEMICTFLPSPVAAQVYRAEWLYQGALDDEAGSAIHTCDENGPLVLYVTRPMPTTDDKGFYFLGRVFSGTVTNDRDVKILEGDWRSPQVGCITATSIISGSTVLTVDSVPAGNVVAIRGKFLERTSSQYESDSFTITTSDVVARCRDMTFMDMAALYVTVSVEKEADTPSLVLGIRSLSRSNPYIDAFFNDRGQYVIQGFDEVRLQDAVDELQTLLGGRCIRISEPLFRYREGIKSASQESCMTRSPNKKISLYVRASPLPEKLTKEISSGEIPTIRDSDRRTTYLTTHHAWSASAAEKIWSFAPSSSGPNTLIDSTIAVQYVSEVRDSLTSGFQWAVSEGPLCEEPLRGVRIDVMDIAMMTDAIHRGGGQLIPTMRRAVYGSVLRTTPVLFEGVYAVEMHLCADRLDAVRGIFDYRRGVVVKEGLDPLGLHVIEAHVRSEQVLGLQQAISPAAGKSTYVHIWFDRWEEFEGDQETLVRRIRKRKGLSDTITSWETFYDSI
ncbi:hypothetical protein BJX62DRAFT_244188 [Aspergillus germanicus]